MRDIDRREFLKLSALSAFAFATGCAPSLGEPKADLTPSRTPVHKEAHNIIPGLGIETFSVDSMTDITDQFPSSEKGNMIKSLSNRADNKIPGFLSFFAEHQVFFERIQSPKDPSQHILVYSGSDGKVFQGFGNDAQDYALANFRKQKELDGGWEFDWLNSHGKVIYRVNGDRGFVDILADVRAKTKTVFSNHEKGATWNYSFSDSGNTLLIRNDKWDGVEGVATRYGVATYIVDLASFKVTAAFGPRNGLMYLNEDGTKVLKIITDPPVTSIYDIKTHKEEALLGPDGNPCGYPISPNFSYVVCSAESKPTSPDRKKFPIAIKTPSGYEELLLPIMTLDRLQNDGTLIARLGGYGGEKYAFKPDQNGKYQTATKISDGVTIPLEDLHN